MSKVSESLQRDIIAAVPRLRAFAVSLSGNRDRADDLVQEAIVKAWANIGSFKEGTNLEAWLFTILRNHFFSEVRKRRREVQDVEGSFSEQLAVHPHQDGHMDLRDFKKALAELPDNQREALVLVGASGFSYEEAAEICGVAMGTIKSRVSRARVELAKRLDIKSEDEYGPDATSETVLSRIAAL